MLNANCVVYVVCVCGIIYASWLAKQCARHRDMERPAKDNPMAVLQWEVANSNARSEDGQIARLVKISEREGASSSSARGLLLLAPVTPGKGLRRDPLLLDEQVDQWLHRLHFLVGYQLVVFRHGDEVDEAHVQDVVLVDVPERVQPVCMVEMSIAAEHLLHNALAILVKRLREAAGLADPFLSSSSASASNFVDRKCLRHAREFLRGEHDGVMDLADDPFLHAVDEFGSRDLSCTSIDKPCVCQSVGKR